MGQLCERAELFVYKMNKKIMAIIKSDKGNYLLLKTNPKWLKVDAWFVVTGSLEKDETEEQAVEREVEEETCLEIIKISPADYSCTYEWPKSSGKMHHEKAFIVIVKEKIPKLSGEHLEYKWLSKKDFLRKIDWNDDKGKLNKII